MISYRVPLDDTPEGCVFMFVKEVCRINDVAFNICHLNGRKFYETVLGPERYFYLDGSPAFNLYCEYAHRELYGVFAWESDDPEQLGE
jgi:hypothetical protein